VVLVIYCGDCLEIMPTLPDKSIDIINRRLELEPGWNRTKGEK
jgi:hypothetical protein